MDDDIRNISVHEELARCEADDLVRGNTAVRAADPEIAWGLLRDERMKEMRISRRCLSCPAAVVLKKPGKHGTAL